MKDIWPDCGGRVEELKQLCTHYLNAVWRPAQRLISVKKSVVSKILQQQALKDAESLCMIWLSDLHHAKNFVWETATAGATGPDGPCRIY
jgi:hypothetical protein